MTLLLKEGQEIAIGAYLETGSDNKSYRFRVTRIADHNKGQERFSGFSGHDNYHAFWHVTRSQNQLSLEQGEL